MKVSFYMMQKVTRVDELQRGRCVGFLGASFSYFSRLLQLAIDTMRWQLAILKQLILPLSSVPGEGASMKECKSY